jgi:hypothetical protein
LRPIGRAEAACARRFAMLEIDNPPLMLFLIVLVALLAPQVYSFYVDKFDKSDKNKGNR